MEQEVKENYSEMNKLREKIAALEHEQWMQWAKSITPELKALTLNHVRGCRCQTCQRLLRWERMIVPYAKLTEEEKDKDREWADKIINILMEEVSGP